MYNAEAQQLLSQFSTCRPETAATVGRLWRRQLDGAPAVLDFGAGDGGLLAAIISESRVERIDLLEPDAATARRAADMLRSFAPVVRCGRLTDSAGVQLVLAAHVLQFVDDTALWMADVASILGSDGAVTCVLSNTDCDAFAFRSIWRTHQGRRPKVMRRGLLTAADAHGFTVTVESIRSVVRFPTRDPRLGRSPHDSNDPTLARLLCWLAGQDPAQEISPELQRDLNEFLCNRWLDGVLAFALVDDAVHLSRLQGRAARGRHDELTRI